MYAYIYIFKIYTKITKRTIDAEYKFNSSGKHLTWLAEYLISEFQMKYQNFFKIWSQTIKNSNGFQQK